MAEQRLIDANDLYGVESLLNTDIVQKSKTASWLMGQVLHDIKASPTINPEDSPIVRQLREELGKERKICDDLQSDLVKTALERDAACKELLECALLLDAECICCAHLKERTVCPMCKEGSQWEWRGPQKEE